ARSYGKTSSKRSSFTDIRKRKEPMAGNFGEGKTRNARLYWESPRLILQMLLSGLQSRQKQNECITTRSDSFVWLATSSIWRRLNQRLKSRKPPKPTAHRTQQPPPKTSLLSHLCL